MPQKNLKFHLMSANRFSNTFTQVYSGTPNLISYISPPVGSDVGVMKVIGTDETNWWWGTGYVTRMYISPFLTFDPDNDIIYHVRLVGGLSLAPQSEFDVVNYMNIFPAMAPSGTFPMISFRASPDLPQMLTLSIGQTNSQGVFSSGTSIDDPNWIETPWSISLDPTAYGLAKTKDLFMYFTKYGQDAAVKTVITYDGVTQYINELAVRNARFDDFETGMGITFQKRYQTNSPPRAIDSVIANVRQLVMEVI